VTSRIYAGCLLVPVLVFCLAPAAFAQTGWRRTYGGPSDDVGYSVEQTSDAGYIVAGYAKSFGAGHEDVYLIKPDASGNELWTRTYGGPGDDMAYSVRQATDGGYIIAGCTNFFGAGSYDVCLIKTDANGNAITEQPPTREHAAATYILIQPNPFTSFARVPGHETDVFILSDAAGRQVAVCRGDRVGEGLRPGIYFLSPAVSRPGSTVAEPAVKAAD